MAAGFSRRRLAAYVAEQSGTAPVTSVQLRQVVDPSVIGGVKIALPGQHYDGTIQHKLTALAGTK